MNKLILTTAIALTLSGCVVGPPNYNERDRRAYNSLEETRKDNVYYDGGYKYVSNGDYYVRDGRYYNRDPYGHYVVVVREDHVTRDKHDHDYDDDGTDDYNPHNGHDHWARHSN